MSQENQQRAEILHNDNFAKCTSANQGQIDHSTQSNTILQDFHEKSDLIAKNFVKEAQISHEQFSKLKKIIQLVQSISKKLQVLQKENKKLRKFNALMAGLNGCLSAYSSGQLSTQKEESFVQDNSILSGNKTLMYENQESFGEFGFKPQSKRNSGSNEHFVPNESSVIESISPNELSDKIETSDHISTIINAPRSIDSLISYLKGVFNGVQLKNAVRIVEVLYQPDQNGNNQENSHILSPTFTKNSPIELKTLMKLTGLPKYRIIEIMGRVNESEQIIGRNMSNGKVFYWIVEE